jgi:hypothetical protein
LRPVWAFSPLQGGYSSPNPETFINRCFNPSKIRQDRMGDRAKPFTGNQIENIDGATILVHSPGAVDKK